MRALRIHLQRYFQSRPLASGLWPLASIILSLQLLPVAASAAGTAEASISMPDFPLPTYAKNKYGGIEAAGILRLLRDLNKGGVHSYDQIEVADTDYAIIESSSLPLISAWLEAACKSVGMNLAQARTGAYDGAVYARLLEVATSIATVRKADAPYAVPIGVVICKRTNPWGVLPGDGQRDAYILFATERGFLVYDPPTRQLCLLSDYPNRSDVVRIRL
jgi:hypothetical protein